MKRERSLGFAWQTYNWNQFFAIITFQIRWNFPFFYLINQFHDDQLQNVTEIIHLIQTRCQIIQCTILVSMQQHQECIPFAWHILLRVQEVGDELRAVGHEPFKVLVNGENCKHSIPTHVRMTMLQTIADNRHQRLKQFGLFQFAQESERWSTKKLIRMLQILRFNEFLIRKMNFDWKYLRKRRLQSSRRKNEKKNWKSQLN